MLSQISDEIMTVDDVVLGAKLIFILSFDRLELLKYCKEEAKSCVMFVPKLTFINVECVP